MVISLVPIELTKRLIDIAIPNKDLHMVMNMILIIFGLHLVLLFVQYVQDLMMTKLGLDITRKMQLDFFSKLLHLPSTYFSHLNPGQLMERIIDDTGEVVDSTIDLVLTPILDIVSIFIAIIYMFTVSPNLTFVALAFVPIFILMTFPVNKIIRKKYMRFKQLSADVYNVMQEKITSFKEITSHNKNDYEKKDLEKHLLRYNLFEYDYEKFSDKLGAVIAIISDLAPYAILLYATILIIKGKFEVGTLMAFSMLMPRLFGPVQALAGKEFEFQTLGITAKRVFSILHDAKPISEGKDVIKKIDGKIEFKNIDAGYSKQMLFTKLNLKFEPNKLIVVVGESGIGKSTIFNLILRTMKTSKGKILLDNQDITKYKIDSLRHHIAIVNQQPVLFSNTLLFNIMYGSSFKTASMSDVINVSKLVNIHETILRLPKKYKTHVDAASSLSSGQMHRITIARALLRNPKILLLDAPTAGLDAESAKHITNSLKKLKKDRTLVVVTNDINITKIADKVILLERTKNGLTTKQGKHKELMKKSKTYKELIE